MDDTIEIKLDADERLAIACHIAKKLYDDPEELEAFLHEDHKGHMAMAFGAPDMETFVNLGELVRGDDGFATLKKLQAFVHEALVQRRLGRIFNSEARREAFMNRPDCFIMPDMVTVSPRQALREYGVDGYKIVMWDIDRLEDLLPGPAV